MNWQKRLMEPGIGKIVLLRHDTDKSDWGITPEYIDYKITRWDNFPNGIRLNDSWIMDKKFFKEHFIMK